MVDKTRSLRTAPTRILHGDRKSPRSDVAIHPAALDIIGAHDVTGRAMIVAFEIVAVLPDLGPDLDGSHSVGAESGSPPGPGKLAQRIRTL
jgi:hypothetical protein